VSFTFAFLFFIRLKSGFCSFVRNRVFDKKKKVWMNPTGSRNGEEETQALRRIMKRSTIGWNITQLDALRKSHSSRAIVTIELSGFLFFGTAMSVLEDVKRYTSYSQPYCLVYFLEFVSACFVMGR
jgi:hypothetical protein